MNTVNYELAWGALKHVLQIDIKVCADAAVTCADNPRIVDRQAAKIEALRSLAVLMDALEVSCAQEGQVA